MPPARRLAATAALALAATVWVATTDTLGGFTTAVVTNSSDAAGSGQLAVTDTYNSTTCAADQSSASPVACNGSALPTSTPSTGTATQTTAVANTGTFAAASITARYRVGGCGPVQLANAVSGTVAGAMLPRTGTTFAPTGGPMTSSGSIGFNGTSGYASNVAATTQPTSGTGTSSTFGIGVWFKTTASVVSPLFGFGSSPLAVAGSNDRILYLDATGKIAFIGNTGGTATTPGTASGVTAYNDGAWHFAWVRFSFTTSLIYTVTVSVDGKTVGVPGSLGTLTGYAGYWHLGWSPVGGTARYFAGSLSDFIVDNGAAAPAAPVSNPTSYTSFDPTRTEQWDLNDTGGAFDGTTVTGVLPSATTLPSSAADPCTYVDVTWALASPAATVLARQSLRAAATASWQTVTANAGPGATQTATITVQRDATFNAYAVGLILYVPNESEYSVGARSWLASFRWSAAAAGAAAGTTLAVG